MKRHVFDIEKEFDWNVRQGDWEPFICTREMALRIHMHGFNTGVDCGRKIAQQEVECGYGDGATWRKSI